ncbi:uncharacterized protein [Pyxicephalus adspersus]|uniref:uncharacterized protein n=1 Tax=Pyxicephalus adspersus TaxID=30357 RepID=UPI003B5B821B
MSSADHNEEESTDSFVDVCEGEDVQEQNAESSPREEQSLESENGTCPQQADIEEEESWETVPENEKDLQENESSKKENGDQSPNPAEHNKTSNDAGKNLTRDETQNFLEATNEGNQNEKHDMRQEENSPPPEGSTARNPNEFQDGESRNKYRESNHSEQIYDGDHEKETRECDGHQGTTAEPEPTKGEEDSKTAPEPTNPEGEERTQGTTAEPGPTKGEKDSKTAPEPTKPEKGARSRGTTAEAEPTKEDSKTEPEPTEGEEDSKIEPEPTKSEGEERTPGTTAEPEP